MPLRPLPGLTPQQYYDTFEDDSQLVRGLKSGGVSTGVGLRANQALQEELAWKALRESGAPETEIATADEKWRTTLDESQQIQQDGEIYAPRVRSLKDVYNSANPISDGLDFAAGAFGSGLASMTPPLVAGAATGLLTRSPKAAYAAAAAAGYQLEKGEAVSRQYNDPVLAATDARDRDNAGVGKAVVNSLFEAAVPAALGASLFRKGATGLAGTTFKAALGESATEGIQTGVGYGAEKYLDPNQTLDPWEVADSMASGFLVGGGVALGAGAPRALLNQLPVTDPNAPAPPPPDQSKLSRTDKFLDALSTTGNPLAAIRAAVSNPADDAAADLVPDTEDPDILNAADPEAAMKQREVDIAARAADNAANLMADPATPDALKERITQGQADPATLANAVVAQDAGKRVGSAILGIVDFVGEKINNLSNKGGTTKSNLQSFGDDTVSPLVELLAQRLGPQAVEAPTLARQLLAAAAMFDGTKPLTRGTAARLEGFSSSIDREVLDMVTSITGTDGLQSTIARIQAIPSATNDVGMGASFLESMLKEPLPLRSKKYLAGVVDDAGLKLGAMNKTATANLLDGLSGFFGGLKEAQTVVDYYGKRRRAAFKAEAEANKLPEDRPNPQDDIKYQTDITQTAQGELSDEQAEKAAEFGALTENGGPANTYKFRDAGKLRPYRTFAKSANTSDGMVRRSKESTLAMMELRRNSPDSARVRPIKYSQYVGDMGLDKDQELRRIVNDTEELLFAEENKNKNQKKNGDRSAKIKELKGQVTMINEIYLQGGSNAALDLFEVLQASQVDKNDQMADDDTVAKYVGLLGKTRKPENFNPARGETKESIEAENKAITDTTITFLKKKGNPIALSAESMWKTQGDKKEKTGATNEPKKKRILRLFNDAVNAMLARPDIKGIKKTTFSSRAPFRSEGRAEPDEVESKAKVLTGKMREGLLIDRETGTRTPKAKTPKQKIADKMQRLANAKENARRDMLDDRRKRLAGAAVEAEAPTRRTPETRTDENKQKFLEEQKQADAKAEAIAKARQENLTGGPKARRAELQERLDEFEAVLTENRAASKPLGQNLVDNMRESEKGMTPETAARSRIDSIKPEKSAGYNDERDIAEQLDEIMQPLRDAAVLASQRMSDAKAELKLARQNNAPKPEQYKLQTEFDLAREELQDIRDTLEDMEGLQFEDSRDRNEDDRKGTTTEEKRGPVGYKGMPRTIMNEQDSDNGETRFYEDDTGAGIAQERGTRTGGAKRIEGKPYSAPSNIEQPSARGRGDKVLPPPGEGQPLRSRQLDTKGKRVDDGTTSRQEGAKTPADFTNHSGGAVGADSMFGTVGKALGFVNQNHYYHGAKTSTGNAPLTDAQVAEGIVHAKAAAEVLGRTWTDKYASLLGRNWFQVKNATQIIAIAPLVKAGGKNAKGYTSRATRTTVDGGTGYAVEMAIANGKKVHVFATNVNKWYVWRDGGFYPSSTPVLDANYAGIGSRQDSGKMTPESVQAIKDVYQNTLDSLGKSGSKAPDLPSTQEPTSSYTRDASGLRATAKQNKDAPSSDVPGRLEQLIASGDAVVDTRTTMVDGKKSVEDTVLVYNAKNTKLLAGTMKNGARYVNTGKLRDEGMLPYIKGSPMLVQVMDAMGITPEQLDAQLGNRARRLSFLRAREANRTKEKTLWSETRATFLALTPTEIISLGISPVGPKPEAPIDKTSSADIDVQGGLNKVNTGRIPVSPREPTWAEVNKLDESPKPGPRPVRDPTWADTLSIMRADLARERTVAARAEQLAAAEANTTEPLDTGKFGEVRGKKVYVNKSKARLDTDAKPIAGREVRSLERAQRRAAIEAAYREDAKKQKAATSTSWREFAEAREVERAMREANKGKGKTRIKVAEGKIVDNSLEARHASIVGGTTKNSLMSTTSDSVYSTPFMTVLHQAGFKIGNDAMGDVVSKLLANPAIAPAQFAKEAAEGLSHMLMLGDYRKAIYKALREHGKSTASSRARRQQQLRAAGVNEQRAEEMSIRELLEKTLLQEVSTHKAPEGFLQILLDLVSKLLDKLNGVANSEAFGKAIAAQFNKFAEDVGTIRKKPEGTELVSFQTAVDRDRAAASVIAYMGKTPATTLVGSIVLATYGTIYRAPDNLLHDLDFVMHMTAEKAKNFLMRGFPNAVQVYSFSIEGRQDANSFIVPPPGATITNITKEKGTKGKLTGYTVMKDGVQIGKMWKVGEKEMKKGSAGALVDLFTPKPGHENKMNRAERVVSFTMGSQTFKVNVASAASIFDAKLAMGREKDLNDFIRFVAKKPTSVLIERKIKPIVGGTTKNSLQEPGKPAVDAEELYWKARTYRNYLEQAAKNDAQIEKVLANPETKPDGEEQELWDIFVERKSGAARDAAIVERIKKHLAELKQSRDNNLSNAASLVATYGKEALDNAPTVRPPQPAQPAQPAQPPQPAQPAQPARPVSDTSAASYYRAVIYSKDRSAEIRRLQSINDTSGQIANMRVLLAGHQKTIEKLVNFYGKDALDAAFAKLEAAGAVPDSHIGAESSRKNWKDTDDVHMNLMANIGAMSIRRLEFFIGNQIKKLDREKMKPAFYDYVNEEILYAKRVLRAKKAAQSAPNQPAPNQSAPNQSAPNQSAPNQPAAPQTRTTPPQGKPRRKTVSKKDQAKVLAHIHRMVGAKVEAEFVSMVKGGGVGSYTLSADKLKQLIEISLYAGNPMSVGRHEALHHFFAFLPNTTAGRSLKKDLLDAANSPRIKKRLHELLEGHPNAQKQIETDMEERLAFMFQFYMETKADGQRMLHLGPTASGIFATIARFLRNAFGIIGKEERAADLLTALNDGKFSKISVVPDVVNEVLTDMPANRVINKLDKTAPAFTALFRKMITTAPDRLRAFNNEPLSELADKFSRVHGTAGFIQQRLQQENLWKNKFGAILKGTTAAQRIVAVENMQAMKTPSSELEKKLAELIEDLRVYMVNAGVKTRSEVVDLDTGAKTATWIALRQVKNYFPRNFDRSKILNDIPGFSALLKKYGKFTAAEIEAVIKQLTHGNGQDDLVEDKHSLGYTPFASATNARKLTFIRQNNAAEFAKYQEKDLADTIGNYIQQAVHRAEYAREFDNDGKQIQDLINKSGVTEPEDLANIFKTIQGLEGSLGNEMSSSTKEIYGAILTLENLVLMPLVLFAQLIDPISIAARTGSLRDAGEAYVIALKRFVRMEVDGEQMANDLGVIAQDSVLEAMSTSFGTVQMGKTSRTISNVFFKYNGLQGWNNSMRIAATKIGARYLLANKLNKTALAEMGLEPKDILMDSKGDLDITTPQVQQAMFRFVDQAVLRPSASSRPVWMSDPRWVLFSHLKQFTFAMHNVVMKRATAQWMEGNTKPWQMLAVAIPISIASSVGKFALTGNVPGWGFFEHLRHGVERSGILGVTDFGFQSLQDGGRGNMPGESILGPTMGHLMTILRWMAGDARTDFGDVVDRTVPGAKFF